MKRTRSHNIHYRMALAGDLPAEALPQFLRWELVAALHADGWTDVEIAEHTRQTLYTTARIRADLCLTPNQPVAPHLYRPIGAA